MVLQNIPSKYLISDFDIHFIYCIGLRVFYNITVLPKNEKFSII
ncbi:hypothetical protein EMIT079MI2_220069 [Bacillus sp. IT-79MI2]